MNVEEKQSKYKFEEFKKDVIQVKEKVNELVDSLRNKYGSAFSIIVDEEATKEGRANFGFMTDISRFE